MMFENFEVLLMSLSSLRAEAQRRPDAVDPRQHAGNGRAADGGGSVQPREGHDRRPQPLQHAVCAGHPASADPRPAGGAAQPRG